MAARYYSAESALKDDFNVPFTGQVDEVVYDAKTQNGLWAMMTEESYKKFAVGKLGTGYGQKFKRNEQGQFVKVEG